MNDKTKKAIDIAEKATCCVAQCGIWLIIDDAVAAVAPTKVKKVGKIARMVGSWVIEGMIEDKAEEYVHKRFDDIREVLGAVKLEVVKEEEENENGSDETAGPDAE